MGGRGRTRRDLEHARRRTASEWGGGFIGRLCRLRLRVGDQKHPARKGEKLNTDNRCSAALRFLL